MKSIALQIEAVVVATYKLLRFRLALPLVMITKQIPIIQLPQEKHAHQSKK